MAKGKRKGKPGKVVTYGSDDERAYSKEDVPDPDDDDFYHDEIDKFHAEKEKILLEKGASLEPAAFGSDEEEVLGVGGSDKSDDEEIAEYEKRLHRFRSQGFKDELASDMEEEAADDGLPDTKAWGKSAAKFYGADVSDSDEDLGDGSGSEPDAAILEEQEAMAIQKKMAAQLDEADIGLDMFKPSAKKPAEAKEEEKITKDLSKLSKKEKLKLLKKESPEMLELIEDFKAKLKELEAHLLPVHQLIKDNKLPASKGTDYVVTKTQLYLNYCVNLSFYLTLKAKHTPVHNHPVIGRIVQYRNLIGQLKVVEDKVQVEMDFILEKLKKGEDIPLAGARDSKRLDAATFVQRKRQMMTLKSKKKDSKTKLSELVSESEEEVEGAMTGEQLLAKGGRTHGRKRGAPSGPEQYETRDEKVALEYYRMLKTGRGLPDGGDKGGVEGEGEQEMQGVEEGEGVGEGLYEDDGDGRRAIDYTIAKNKGLTRKRKKEYRNPRVRNRMKHKQAVKRRKGQVRVVRKELTPYAGELSGIRAGVKKSVKFKS